MSNLSTTWSLDELTADQRELLGEYLCQTNDGAYSFSDDESRNVLERMIPAAEALAKLGLVQIDADGDECVVSFTSEGEAWIRNLPEGALS